MTGHETAAVLLTEAATVLDRLGHHQAARIVARPLDESRDSDLFGVAGDFLRTSPRRDLP